MWQHVMFIYETVATLRSPADCCIDSRLWSFLLSFCFSLLNWFFFSSWLPPSFWCWGCLPFPLSHSLGLNLGVFSSALYFFSRSFFLLPLSSLLFFVVCSCTYYIIYRALYPPYFYMICHARMFFLPCSHQSSSFAWFASLYMLHTNTLVASSWSA